MTPTSRVSSLERSQFSGYHYKQAHGKGLWQRYGYERVLREEESTQRVVAYVLENPVRAGLVKTVHDYPFIRSSVTTGRR